MNGAWDEGSQWLPGLAHIREWSGAPNPLKAVVLLAPPAGETYMWRVYDISTAGLIEDSAGDYPTIEAARDACVLWLSTKRLAGEFVDL